MVVHNTRRLWTRLERQRNYEFGITYCSRYGYQRFKKMGKNYLFTYFNLTSSFFFNLTIFSKTYSFFNFFLELECWEVANMIYDNESMWLYRPENPRPPTKKDKERRRSLLHAMGNQFARYLAVTKAESVRIQNNVNRQNPIVIDN